MVLDIKFIRENTEKVKENLRKREGYDLTIIDNVLNIDQKWRAKKGELDQLKAQKNKESKKIAEVKKSGGDIKQQIAKVKKVSDDIEDKDKELKEINDKRQELLIKIPNMLDDSVPVGADDENNVPIRFHLEKPTFGFEIRNYDDLCKLNDWADLETAAKTSGARFYYLKNELVMLQTAIFNYVLDKLQKKGYTPIEVPPMLRRDVLGKSVSLEDFEEVIYKIEDEDLYLIGTSEHGLAAMHMDEVLNHKDLPLKYAGISPCFRKEAGVTKDSKGIFRVHNFNKIEQFVFCKPEDSEKFHEEITANAEEIFQDLGLHYQVVNICSGDMGSFATKKFDIEGWLPGQERYRELVSASNYKTYGARRLNCRFQNEKNEIEYVHTLNSTAIALTRGMIAIIEQHQTKDGNVVIPKVLRPYFGGRELLIER